MWRRFWLGYTGAGLSLPSGLGRWIAQSHQVWECFVDDEATRIEVSRGGTATSYYPTRHGRTRSSRIFAKTAELSGLSGLCRRPCSVIWRTPSTLQLDSIGPPPAAADATQESFTDFIRSWGGDWMWSNIVNEGGTLRWVAAALKGGSAMVVADGSYQREIAPSCSGSGWVFHCTRCKLKLYGSFHEFSREASSYRAELLGLLALHALLAAITIYFQVPAGKAKLCCDNAGALHKSRERRRRIPTGSAHADVLRALRNITTKALPSIIYEWVPSHQDDLKSWAALTTEQQLNCVCDSLAKSAVQDSLHCLDPWMRPQTLPGELAAVVLDGVKQTGDVADGVRFALGLTEARRFYTAPRGRRDSAGRWPKDSGLGWSPVSFDAVDWRMLALTLDSKPKMYQLWLTKQVTGFCGTQSMMAHWDDERDGKCPNCGAPETSEHLTLCRSPVRVSLFEDMTHDLASWLSSAFAHDELATWVPEYILARGTRRLSSFGPLSSEMKHVARQQDLIPWRGFMEGRVCTALFILQEQALASSPSRLTISSWGKQFLSRLLHISHGQWLLRNASVHHSTQGYLQKCHRHTLLREIDRLAHLSPADLPASSRYLLEIDFSSLKTSSTEDQSYWVLAMRAAIHPHKPPQAPAHSRPSQACSVASRRDNQDTVPD